MANSDDFKALVSKDPALRDKLSAAKNASDVVSIAKDAGFNFTIQEVEAEMKATEISEMSDAAMESVAGGFLNMNDGGRQCNWGVG